MNSVKEVLNGWYERVTNAQKAHYLSANHFTRWMEYGAWNTGDCAIGNCRHINIFCSPESSRTVRSDFGWSLQPDGDSARQSSNFLGHSERAEKHRVAGAKYGALCRELEILRASAEDPPKEVIENIRKRLDDLALESPNNSQKICNIAVGASSKPPS
jgi:hypothetical protein